MTTKEWPRVVGRPNYYPPMGTTSLQAARWANAIAKALAKGPNGTQFLTQAERSDLAVLRDRLIRDCHLEPEP